MSKKTSYTHIPDLRTYAYHQIAAEILEENPERLMDIYVVLKHWTTLDGSQAQAWAGKWFELLHGLSFGEIVELITQKGETMDFYRKSSPFASLLSQEERQMILMRYPFNHENTPT